MLKYSVHSRLRESHLKRRLAGQSGGVFIDVGCGLGYLSRVLPPPGSLAIGADYDEASLRLNRRSGLPNMIRSGADRLPFADNSADVVLCSEVLEHLPEPLDRHALAELIRILKPGGKLLITVPSLEGLRATTRLRNLGHDDPEGGEYHHRIGYAWDTMAAMVAEIPEARIVYRGYSMFLISELFMDLLKLVYLRKNKLKEHSDIDAEPKGLLFKVYKAVFPVLDAIFQLEDRLLCPLFKGHILVLELGKKAG